MTLEKHERYVVLSLELHLFFARIMKEHALFLKAGFAPVDGDLVKSADYFKEAFEMVLYRAIRLGDGVVGKGVLRSGELVTEFTACAERQTAHLTGIHINEHLTTMEARLHCGESCRVDTALCTQVTQLNRTALRLLDGLIALKERVLESVLCCKLFTTNYPLLLEHIIREAKLYRTYLCNYESGMDFDCQTMKPLEQFWNQIMMEHALFIRSLLDPTENTLIETADGFAKDYERLLASCRETHDQTIGGTNAALAQTLKFRDFKAAGTKGIEECKIRSIILPLLADHVLREANHYIRLLGE